jgi:AraC-like DNA-binding protein
MKRSGAVDIYKDHDEARSTTIGSATLVASHTRGATLGPDAEIHAAPQESFSLIYMFDHLPAHEFWSDEGHINVPDLPRGSMHIMDLRPSGNARFHSSFDTMNIAIPRTALDALADQIGTAAPKDLHVPHAWDWRDPIMDGMQAAIAQAIAAGGEVDNLVFDHLLMALLTHAAITYGEMRMPSPGMRGALGGPQLKRAQDAMMESLEDPVALAEIARRCDLSPSHFSRAFKLATGKAPSEWRMERRIERAQKLLRGDEHSIAQVALLSGFADQSHFTRVFSRHIGQSPANWARGRR